MGANNGTGQPNNLKCSRCIRHRSWRPARCGMNLKATGKERPLSKAQLGNGGARVMMRQVQYECLDCGHVGWSRHKDAGRLLERLK